MSLPPIVAMDNDRYGVYRGDTWGPHLFQCCRILADAIITTGAPTLLRSDSAVFTADDVGIAVKFLTAAGTEDPNQPKGLTIASRTDASHVVLSGPITGHIAGAADGGYVMVCRRDLTGLTAVGGSIKVSPTDPTEITPISAATVGALVLGQVSLSMPYTATDVFTIAGPYVYDVQATFAGSPIVKRTLMRGPIVVTWDVERP